MKPTKLRFTSKRGSTSLQLDLQLFNEWMGDPHSAFDAWLESENNSKFRPSSKIIYRALWAKFLRWLSIKGIAFNQVEPEAIKDFLLNLNDVKRPQRERYQQVIQRAFESFQTGALPSIPRLDATKIVDIDRTGWRNAPDNAPMQFLSVTQQEHLQMSIHREFLACQQITRQSRSEIKPKEWRSIRDLAIVTTLFTAGLKASEIMVLSVNCKINLGPDYYIDASQYQGLAAHEIAELKRANPRTDATHAFRGETRGTNRLISIPAWSGRVLDLWEIVQSHEAQDNMDTDRSIHRLFSGNRRVTKNRMTSLMHPATLVRIVSKWCQRFASIECTPQMLRNTFGARLLAANATLQKVELAMGYVPGTGAAFRLNAAWQSWIAHHSGD